MTSETDGKRWEWCRLKNFRKSYLKLKADIWKAKKRISIGSESAGCKCECEFHVVAYVLTCTYADEYAGSCFCRSQRNMSSVFLFTFPFYSFETESLVEPGVYHLDYVDQSVTSHCPTIIILPHYHYPAPNAEDTGIDMPDQCLIFT